LIPFCESSCSRVLTVLGLMDRLAERRRRASNGEGRGM